MRGIRSSRRVSSRVARRVAVLLERVAAREHERDDAAGQVLAEGEGGRDRDERDRVDPHVAPQERAQDGSDSGTRSSDVAAAKEPVGGRVPVCARQRQPERDGRQRGHRDQPRAVRAELAGRSPTPCSGHGFIFRLDPTLGLSTNPQPARGIR